MNILSNIGFGVENQEEFVELVYKLLELATPIEVEEGFYLKFTDSSGAELWLIFNDGEELVATTPSYDGYSKRTVFLTSSIQHQNCCLSASIYSWAGSFSQDDHDYGVYPFVFEYPGVKSISEFHLPVKADVQISAFVVEIQYFEQEKEFALAQSKEEIELSPQSFIPVGLFSEQGELVDDAISNFAFFSGQIKDCNRLKNSITNQEFYWLLIDTLGGEVDVLANLSHFKHEPQINGIIMGEFLLYGKLTSPLDL